MTYWKYAYAFIIFTLIGIVFNHLIAKFHSRVAHNTFKIEIPEKVFRIIYYIIYGIVMLILGLSLYDKLKSEFF